MGCLALLILAAQELCTQDVFMLDVIYEMLFLDWPVLGLLLAESHVLKSEMENFQRVLCNLPLYLI